MELGNYIKQVLKDAKENGAKIVEFDIGLYTRPSGNKIAVDPDSLNRIRFSVLLNTKKK